MDFNQRWIKKKKKMVVPENLTQYSVMTYMGKESKKEQLHI